MRRNILFHEEMALVPATMGLASHVKRERQLRQQIRDMLVQIRMHGQWDLVTDLRNLQMTLFHHMSHDRHAPSEDQMTQWMHRCAYVECHGHLDRNGVCSVCDRSTCIECGVPVEAGERHVCDPELLESLQLIRAECRPCVRCHAPSMRLEGCPTMWCPQCHCFWNWDTRRIIETRNHVPHNPDHRQWLRNEQRQHREVEDLPCGGIPDGHQIHMAILRDIHSDPFSNMTDATNIIVEAMDSLHSIQRVRGRYPRVWDPALINQDARVRYINGEIDDAAFMQLIERNERFCEFRRDVGDILETFVLSATDVFQCHAHAVDTTATAISLVHLRSYVDEELACLSKMHERTSPRIGMNWRWTLPYHRRVV